MSTPAETPPANSPTKPKISPALKFALEFGPLVVFFLVNLKFGLFAATAALMPLVVIALAVSYALTRTWPVMPVVSGTMVLIFGALTLYLHDETFVKMKPTIVNLLFGAALLGGLAFGKSLLSVMLDSAFTLEEEGWRRLTLRWGIFFFVLAGLNEVVWRFFSTDTWTYFKVFGIMPLTMLFAMAQYPLLIRYDTSGVFRTYDKAE